MSPQLNIEDMVIIPALSILIGSSWGSCHTWPRQAEGPGRGPQPESTKHTNARASTPMIRGHLDRWKWQEYGERRAKQGKIYRVHAAGQSPGSLQKEERKGLREVHVQPSYWCHMGFIEYLVCALSCYATLFKPHTDAMRKHYEAELPPTSPTILLTKTTWLST